MPDLTAQFTPTTEQMEGTHYGVAVCSLGEDGDMLALGHHEPRKALAAFNRHARVFLGLANLFDDRSVKAADALEDVSAKWALFGPPDPANQWEDPDCDWYVNSAATAETPGAVPVMLLRA
jgi:hypothetical protein